MSTAAPASRVHWQSAALFSEDRIWCYVAGWLAVPIGSLLSFLNFHEYPLLSGEIAIIVAVVAILAIALGALHARSGRLRPLMDAALAYLAVDLNFDAPYSAIAAVAVLVLAIILKRSLTPVLAVIFAVVVGGQLLNTARAADNKPGSANAIPGPESALPAIVHVVFDEHSGIAGLEPSDPAIGDLRDDVLRKYISLGFVVYGDAHSRHFHTTNSLPEILNFGETKLGGRPRANLASKVNTNAYFDALAAQGHRINVLQSDFVDYCSHQAVKSCSTYRRSDLAPLATSTLPPADRARVISAAFASLSGGLVVASMFYDHYAGKLAGTAFEPPLLNLDMVRLTSTLAAFDAANMLSDGLRSARPGNVYFTHLLFPHYPYVTRTDCTLKPLSDWQYRRVGGTLATRTRGYADQVRCAARQVTKFVEAVEKSPAAGNTVFIVHGDHGSRITINDPKITNFEQVADRDILAGYSTLLAVRTVKPTGGYESGMAPVSGILKAFTDGRFKTAPETSQAIAGTGEVFIEDNGWRPIAAHRLKPAGKGWSLREN